MAHNMHANPRKVRYFGLQFFTVTILGSFNPAPTPFEILVLSKCLKTWLKHTLARIGFERTTLFLIVRFYAMQLLSIPSASWSRFLQAKNCKISLKYYQKFWILTPPNITFLDFIEFDISATSLNFVVKLLCGSEFRIFHYGGFQLVSHTDKLVTAVFCVKILRRVRYCQMWASAPYGDIDQTIIMIFRYAVNVVFDFPAKLDWHSFQIRPYKH